MRILLRDKSRTLAYERILLPSLGQGKGKTVKKSSTFVSKFYSCKIYCNKIMEI